MLLRMSRGNFFQLAASSDKTGMSHSRAIHSPRHRGGWRTHKPFSYSLPIRHSSSCTADTLRWNIRNVSISFVRDTQFLRQKLFLSSNQSLRWPS
jgi:hypothetical protein